jgi:hypothetical protein
MPVHLVPFVRPLPSTNFRPHTSIHWRSFVVVHPYRRVIFFKSYVLRLIPYVSNTIFF